MSIKILLPDSKEKKPLKLSNGGFYTDSNFKSQKLSPSEIMKKTKRTNKSLGIDKFISFIAVKDCGDYYTRTTG